VKATLRISLTDRCNLKCSYCMPGEGIKVSPKKDILRFEEIEAFISHLQKKVSLQKVNLTGGEPLLRQGLPFFIDKLVKKGISDISLTTNGLLLSQSLDSLVSAGLSRINISLDTLNPVLFKKLTGYEGIDNILSGIEKAKKMGISPIKINCVMLKNKNWKELKNLLKFCYNKGLLLRFLELMPIGPAKLFYDKEFISSKEIQQYLKKEGYIHKHVASPENQVAKNYQLTFPDGKTMTIGYISSQTGPFCKGCTRLRLTAQGDFIPCLLQNYRINIREFARLSNDMSNKKITELIEWALSCKTFSHKSKHQNYMVELGG